jgi:hypothetical protein
MGKCWRWWKPSKQRVKSTYHEQHHHNRLVSFIWGIADDVLIIDFWENNLSRDAKEVVNQSTPVLVTIFNTHLRLLDTWLKDRKDPDCKQVIADLREQIQQKRHLETADLYDAPSLWDFGRMRWKRCLQKKK